MNSSYTDPRRDASLSRRILHKNIQTCVLREISSGLRNNIFCFHMLYSAKYYPGGKKQRFSVAAIAKHRETDVPLSSLFCGNLVAHAAVSVMAPKVLRVLFQLLQIPPVTKKTDWHAPSISIFVPSSQPFTFDMLGNWQLSTDGANQNVVMLLQIFSNGSYLSNKSRG